MFDKTRTDLFKYFFREEQGALGYFLHPEKTRDSIAANSLNYQDITDLLLTVNDAQFDIFSYYDKLSNTWVRDSTRSRPLKDRIPYDSPVIEANNALLRCLSRLRPIDYAIQKQEDKFEILLKVLPPFWSKIDLVRSRLYFALVIAT